MKTHILTTTICSFMFMSTPLHADNFLVPAGGDIQSVIDITSDGDVIQLEVGTYLPDNALSIDGKAITIRGALDGSGQPASVIDAQGAHRVFLIETGTGEVTLENLQIVNGQPNATEIDPSRGGGIYAPGNARLVSRSCWFTDNISGSGGAFHCLGSRPRLVFTDCVFTGNEDAGGGGAAIAHAYEDAPDPVAAPSCLIEGCRFIDNQNNGSSGVVAAGFARADHLMTVRDCEFTGNDGVTTLFIIGEESIATEIEGCTFEDTTGTAIQWGSGDLTVRNCTLTGQTETFSVAIQGYSPAFAVESLLVEDSVFRAFSVGAIYLSPLNVSSVEGCEIRSSEFRDIRGRRAVTLGSMPFARATLVDCLFTQNFSADGFGGAVAGRNIDFLRCLWSNNVANGGAAILAEDVEIVECWFNENFSGVDGGVVKATSLRARNCEFTNNATQGSGGALVVDEGTASITDCYFFRNFASSGGALQMDNAQEVEIVNSHFERHEASGSGGAILIDYNNPGVGNQLRLDNCKFIDNTGLLGGAIFNDGFTLPEVRDTLFCRNSLDQIFGQFSDLGGNTFQDEGNCIVVPGDFDGNLVVDGADLAVLLGDWGPCTSAGCSADLDGNGTVNGADLSIVLGNWGPHDA